MTITFKNAVLLIDGIEVTGALHEVNMESTAEMLDASVFGLNTRLKKAGLWMDKIAGKLFFDGSVGSENCIFNEMAAEPTLIVLYPDGVTEGSTTTGYGFAMKGVATQMTLGGQVGTLLDLAFGFDNNGTDT